MEPTMGPATQVWLSEEGWFDSTMVEDVDVAVVTAVLFFAYAEAASAEASDPADS
jgi:hypothetical protein